MVIAKRREIFAGADSPVSILTAAQSVQAALAEFGEAAGILPSRDELGIAVESALEKAQAGRAERSKERAESVREALDRALVESADAIRESLRGDLGASRGDDLEAVLEGYLSDGRDRMVEQLGRSPRTESDRADPALNSETWLAILDAVKRTDIHACEGEFRKRLRALDRNISLEPERFTVREAVDRILLCGFVARNDCEAGPSPNVMALAQRILDLFLTPVSGVNEESDSGKRRQGLFRCHQAGKTRKLQSARLVSVASPQAPVRAGNRTGLARRQALGNAVPFRGEGGSLRALREHPGPRAAGVPGFRGAGARLDALFRDRAVLETPRRRTLIEDRRFCGGRGRGRGPHRLGDPTQARRRARDDCRQSHEGQFLRVGLGERGSCGRNQEAAGSVCGGRISPVRHRGRQSRRAELLRHLPVLQRLLRAVLAVPSPASSTRSPGWAAITSRTKQRYRCC